MESELERLASFVALPSSASSTGVTSRLSRSGFYYGGHGHVVTCYRCRREFSDWQSVDGLLDLHRPMDCQPEDPDNGQPTSADGQTLESDAASAMSNQQTRPTRDQDACFTELANRVESYRGHPVGAGPAVERLVEAGFDYVGPRDNARCFQCSGELNDWRPTDEPWSEHARWFPRCPVLRRLATDDVAAVATSETSQHHGFFGAHSEDSRFDVDQRHVEEQMESEISQAVIRMGVNVEIIRSVIERYLATTGYDFTSSEDLLQAVWQFQDEHPDFHRGRQLQQPKPRRNESQDSNRNIPPSLHDTGDDFHRRQQQELSDDLEDIPANTSPTSHDTDDGATDNLSDGILPLREDVGPAEHNVFVEQPKAPIVFMADGNGVELMSLHHDNSANADEGYATVSSGSGSE